jgi:phosphohistidine phosphatase
VTDRRVLIVMRHAQAEPFAATDHERRLTDRGERAASSAGAFLAESGVDPDHVLASPSTRTRATWEKVAAASGSTAEPVLDDGLYLGGTDAALESLRALPPEARTVLLVGHNPAASDLSHLLDDGRGEPLAVDELLRGFPPGAAAVFEVAGPWADLGADSGRLVLFHAA